MGSFDPNNPSTWPCEELLECSETDPVYGITGDPDLAKGGGSLEESEVAPASFARRPELIVPAGFPDYSETLAADPCNAAPVATEENGQLDARSGNSGNKKWGLFIEPDISQQYDIEMSGVMGLPSLNLEAIGSFRAGAYVFGIEIEVINARAEAILSTCGGRLGPSLKILGIEVKSWSSYDGEEQPATAPSEQESLDCINAINSLSDKLANLRKGLLDARAAWDAYRRNGAPPLELCERTQAVLGNVDPGGCTVESARAWLNHYQSLVTETQDYVEGQYREILKTVGEKTEGAISFSPVEGGPLATVGAVSYYPVGPIVVTLEVEVAGGIDASGTLAYSAGLEGLATGDGGPNVRVEAGPGAYVDAFVFVGAGIPGVSVGVEGQLRLIGVSAPVYAEVGLARRSFQDPREPDSSGLFASVIDGPPLLGNGSMQNWSAGWGYGSSVVLDSLAGKINLAARVRLGFFKKTFRKRIADWEGATTRYDFVGSRGVPLGGNTESDVAHDDVPYPGLGDLEAAFDATPLGPDLPVSTLGGTDTPGACGCADLQSACSSDSDCCNNYICSNDVCVVPQCVEHGGACTTALECCPQPYGVDCENNQCVARSLG
jgi:hypothetical protein